MAAGYLPRPGSKFGACALGNDYRLNCGHRDCAEAYATAMALCHYCGKPIGYETPYFSEYGNSSVQSVHLKCAERAAEDKERSNA